MNKMIAALVGGLFDENGISAFSRPVLFGTAGDAALAGLPEEVQACFFVHGAAEKPLAGAGSITLQSGSRYAALAALPESEHVLVMGAPVVPVNGRTMPRLMQTHLTTGYGVTVLAAEKKSFDVDGQEAAENPYAMAVFTRAALSAAVKSGANTLPELVAAAVDAGAQRGVAASNTILEVRDGKSAYEVHLALQKRINFALIEKGVHIFDPAGTYIAPDAKIEAGATILPACHIRAGCTVGAGAVIGPNSILEKCEIGAGTTVNNSQVYESVIGKNTTVGPFAYVRPQCVIGDGCRIGDFVEMKKSTIGNGTKVSHLTYIGDAQVGERVNFGCGTVVVNYDGHNKYQTKIGDDCFIGCNTNLVSPVSLGDRVFTAAGTTVTKDVPDGALAVARARQSVLEGWNDKRRAQHEQEKK